MVNGSDAGGLDDENVQRSTFNIQRPMVAMRKALNIRSSLGTPSCTRQKCRAKARP